MSHDFVMRENNNQFEKIRESCGRDELDLDTNNVRLTVPLAKNNQ